ncbi:hypothetical protein IFM89_020798 [Coptis chinensis]|uniref:Uncharacterized protein n=1 Tax=Coptis chinensis TaxID=261450 RepID=A0A835LWL8_9MAGN|nr:hypothetical protein IFM89_020798 [Coptis chinensis]
MSFSIESRWILPEKRVEKLTKQAIKNVRERDRDELQSDRSGEGVSFTHSIVRLSGCMVLNVSRVPWLLRQCFDLRGVESSPIPHRTLTPVPKGNLIDDSSLSKVAVLGMVCLGQNQIPMSDVFYEALVFADANAIKQNSMKLGAREDLYALFVGILTMRPWNRVIDPAVDHLVIKGNDSDRSELQMYASQYFPQISELLKRLPHVILLMLKTNDCLRAVTNCLVILGPVEASVDAVCQIDDFFIFFCVSASTCLRGYTSVSVCTFMAARHEKLESLQLGPEFCERISSDAIKMVGLCCPKLRILRLSGVMDVGEDAINALAKNCKQLEEICLTV